MTELATPTDEFRQPPHPLLKDYYGSERQRRERVSRWFDDSATHYDWICRVMSGATDRRYRFDALQRAGLREGMRALDVACGTGLVAGEAQRLVGPTGRVLGIDASTGMMQQAITRHGLRASAGLAERLPIASGAFDFLSMGFALRHVNDLRVTFEEYRRVLRPGGRLLILEITPPRNRFAFVMLRFYLKQIVPTITRLGRRSASAEEMMRYYWDTIEQCVDPATIESALLVSGFTDVERTVSLGIFSEYTATRPPLARTALSA